MKFTRCGLDIAKQVFQVHLLAYLIIGGVLVLIEPLKRTISEEVAKTLDQS